MTQRNGSTKGLAALVVLALLSLTPATPLASDGTPEGARVWGTVLSSADAKPVAGATVHLAVEGSSRVHSSAPTDAEGRFEIGDVPTGAFQVGVALDQALYVVEQNLEIGADGSRYVQIFVDVKASPTDDGPVLTGRRAALWDNPITSALVVIGGAILVGVGVEALDDDDEDDATPVN